MPEIYRLLVARRIGYNSTLPTKDRRVGARDLEPKANGAEAETRPDRVTIVSFVFLCLLVGANPVAIRFSNRELAPFWGAGVRFTVATLLFLLLARVRRVALPRGRPLARAALYGAVGIGGFFAFGYWGLVRVQAGLGAVIFATVPLLTFFAAFAHRLEPWRWRGLIGALIVTGGTAVVFGEELGANVPLLSLLSLLAAAVLAAETNIIVKRIPQMDPIATNVVAMAVGALILLALSFVRGEPHRIPTHAPTWEALAYLSTIGTLGIFILFLFVLQRWNASSVAYEFVLAPFVSALLGWWLLNESIKPITAVGAAVVLAGVYVGALAPGGRLRGASRSR
jgi:drug/metabolite transporter (DMT)-like permease